MSETDYLDKHEQKAIKERLNAIAEWVADALDATVTRQNKFSIGPKAGQQKRRETPLPFHMQASDASTDLNGTLMAWITVVCQQRKYAWPGRLRNGQAARWLAAHVTALALCEGSRAAADEISDAHDRVMRVIDRPTFRTYHGECELCGGDLYGRRDADKLTCDKCADVVDRQSNNIRLEAILEDKLYTADELVTIVFDRFGATIKSKTVHDLAYRKVNPILVRGTAYNGRHKLYRAGDVFAALRQREVIA